METETERMRMKMTRKGEETENLTPLLTILAHDRTGISLMFLQEDTPFFFLARYVIAAVGVVSRSTYIYQ